MKKWSKMEYVMQRDYAFPVNLEWRFKIITASSLGSALIYSTLFAGSFAYKCKQQNMTSTTCYLKYRFSYLFAYYEYNIYFALFVWVRLKFKMQM